MQPTDLILDRIAELLAEDTTTLAPAALACEVHLAMNAFSPGTGTVLADLTEADFDGATEIDAGVGPQQNFIDPTTGRRVIQLLEPAGGWHWITTGVTNLPQTIYGYYVTNNGGTILYGCALLPAPVLLTGVGQAIDLPQVRFTFLPGSPI